MNFIHNLKNEDLPQITQLPNEVEESSSGVKPYVIFSAQPQALPG